MTGRHLRCRHGRDVIRGGLRSPGTGGRPRVEVDAWTAAHEVRGKPPALVGTDADVAVAVPAGGPGAAPAAGALAGAVVGVAVPASGNTVGTTASGAGAGTTGG